MCQRNEHKTLKCMFNVVHVPLLTPACSLNACPDFPVKKQSAKNHNQTTQPPKPTVMIESKELY